MRKLWHALATLFALGVLTVAALVAIGLAGAVAQPIERQAELPAPLAAPYRVALLSDIHFGNRAMQRKRLDAIVAAVNAAQPDLVVITGDFVNGHDGKLASDPQDLIAPLAALKPTGGVVAVPGNHDHWTDPAKVRAALEAAGVTVLANQAVRRGPLLVLGIDDGFTGHDDIAKVMASAQGLGGLPVAISHSPDIAPRLPPKVGVLLAGHTHCGQVVLPLVGSLAPLLGYHVYDPRYQCGRVSDPGRTVIVTAGLGSGSIPFRVGAPPDWWLVTFRAP